LVNLGSESLRLLRVDFFLLLFIIYDNRGKEVSIMEVKVKIRGKKLVVSSKDVEKVAEG